MTRLELKNYILENFNASNDRPWSSFPDYEVFRHVNNQKWFAVIMNVSRGKLGLPGPGSIDIVNFKCDPLMSGSFRSLPGFFPAYHMNKEKWISAALDGSVSEEAIKMLLEISYDSTATPSRK